MISLFIMKHLIYIHTICELCYGLFFMHAVQSQCNQQVAIHFRSSIVEMVMKMKPLCVYIQHLILLYSFSSANNNFHCLDYYRRFSGGTELEEGGQDTTLNIFSLASGHLYERFLRIMMLSVLKNTQSKVKFWFLKNYLSPSFKVSCI